MSSQRIVIFCLSASLSLVGETTSELVKNYEEALTQFGLFCSEKKALSPWLETMLDLQKQLDSVEEKK